jgi:16S rRNA (adenine1518-N6/adenine1519-N6)-dimethyltransferase
MGNYLGQHFLKNKAKLRKIVDALELKDGDIVIEIGPGHGELTNEIVSKFKSLKVENFKIIAIEKDKELAEKLKEKFKQDKNIEIIEGDALKALPQIIQDYRLQTTNYKLVGNIPYYITGYLFRIMGELEIKPKLIVLLIQKEVAERVCALRQAQGKPQMNLLAASVQFWAEPKIIGYVPRNDFEPAPKVDSTIIKLLPVTSQLLSRLKCNREKYYKFIKILFKQPRKTIVNNLLGIRKQELVNSKQGTEVNNKEEIIGKLNKVGVEPRARPQDLSIEQIIKLSVMDFN